MRSHRKARKKMTESQRKQIEWICDTLGIKYEGQSVGDAWNFIREHREEAERVQKEIDDSWDETFIGG